MSSRGNLEFDIKCIQLDPNAGLCNPFVSPAFGVASCTNVIMIEPSGPSIQTAIIFASLSATVTNPYVVSLCPGVYTENVTLSSNVHLSASTPAFQIGSNVTGALVSNHNPVTITGTIIDNGVEVVTSLSGITLDGPLNVASSTSFIGLNNCMIRGNMLCSGRIDLRGCVGDRTVGMTHTIRPQGGIGALITWNGNELGGTTVGLATVFVLEGGNVDGLARINLYNVTMNGRFETRVGALSTIPSNLIVIQNSSVRYPVAAGTTPVDRMFYHDTVVGGGIGSTRVIITNSSIDSAAGLHPIALNSLAAGTAPRYTMAGVGFVGGVTPPAPGFPLDDADAGAPPSLLGGPLSDPGFGVIDGIPAATY